MGAQDREEGGQDGASRLQGLLSSDGPVTIERPRRAEFGDYSTNAALVLAPVLGSKPRELAESLGAVLHEVSHNLQNELGLAKAVPRKIARRLLDAGLGRSVAMVWVRWNRETFADLSGLLLGGPAVVASLMDVIGRSPAATYHFSDGGVHPAPYLRTLISVELLRRMGFDEQADDIQSDVDAIRAGGFEALAGSYGL